MNIELKERLAEALEYETFTSVSGTVYIKNTRKVNIRTKIWSAEPHKKFTPETDDALFKRCLVELYENGFRLNGSDEEYYMSEYVQGVFCPGPVFKTPTEAVFTAFCEMKE